MTANAQTQREAPAGSDQNYTCTFGIFNQTTPWADVRSYSWLELGGLLSDHQIGPKEGSCIVPAVFSGIRRSNADARRIELVFLDIDDGTTRREIAAAIAAKGYAAIITSTHSHMTTRTRIRRSNWEKFRAAAADPTTAPADFLMVEKGYLPRIAAGATLVQEDAEYIVFEHQPCPKFRVVIPLLRPWEAANYRNQQEANEVWKEQVEALAASLGLQIDQACTDTSRAFFMPRRPADGPLPETAILDGTECDLFALPKAGPSRGRQQGRSKRSSMGLPPDEFQYVDPRTGQVHDLAAWASELGPRFQIVDALQARSPVVFTGKVVEGKHHLRCVNEHAHSQAGTDDATFVKNASDSTSRGFVYHCRHAHCDGVDRLIFVRQMLDAGWLTIDDLTCDAFLLPAGDEGGEANLSPEFSDDSVALALSVLLNGQALYVAGWNRWLFWDGSRWMADETLHIFSRARELCRGVAGTAKAGGKSGAAVAKRLVSANTIAAVERLARSDPRHARKTGDFDADPWALNTPSGVVNLRTGELRPHRRDDLVTKVTSVGPGGRCPRWHRFLLQITRRDKAVIRYLQRFIGYTLTGVTDEHAFVFLFGPGKNGKSVLLSTIAAMLGDYAKVAMADVFTVGSGEQHPTHLAALRGARLVLVTETAQDRPWAEARLKALTGGDRITARVMHGDPFEFTPQFKLWIAGNHRPALRNPDAAMRRRLHLVPLTYVPAVPDPSLAETLRAELPGILAWAIRGCLDWQQQGLNPPPVIRSATDSYFEDEDTLAEWVNTRCLLDPKAETGTRVLFSDWKEWCSSRNEEPGTEKRFSEALERHAVKKRTNTGAVFKGLKLLPSDTGVW
ncbi:phage/plasmid primase, P4 family [Belnapia sp. F-4-1]|uniref:phage/plasmid primase, P4 family n=1 Tax=Belnapia sp. F-4-1 TaxID=1545443 RepID=UPI00068CB056|nr:phage/plasmid primase, P4 family [Belnapia sp. F-4-1]